MTSLRAASAVFLLAFLTGALRAQEGILLKPDSNIRIVEYGDFGNAGGWMTELMERYLLRALRKKSLSGVGPDVTFILQPRAAEWQDAPRERLRDPADLDSFEIETSARPSPTVRITGMTVLSTGFGVMHFLEKRLGIIWLFPGDLGTCVPERAEFILPVGKERVAPEFVSRLCTGFVYRDKTIPAKRFVYQGLLHRQSLFFYSHDYFKSLKLHFLASPSHNMINIFPLSTREEHPDLLPIKDGRRWVPPDKDSPQGKVGWWQAWHPCYTNPKTVEVAAAKGKEAFEKGAYCFSLGINDGQRVQCECENCRKTGWPVSYYRFVSQVAERLKGFYPPRLVGVIAYGDVTFPPKDRVLPENVLVMAASGGPERFKDWSQCARWLGTYEWATGQGYWIPDFPLAGMAANARYYRDHRVRFFRAEIGPMWAFDGPKVWLRLRQLWEPDLDLDAGLRQYCDAAFGKGGAEMRALYRHWAGKRPDVIAEGVTPMHMPSLTTGDSWRDAGAQFLAVSAEDLDYSLAQVAKARELDGSDMVSRRLEMVGTFFEDSRTLYAMKELAETSLDPSAERNWSAVMADAEGLLAKRRTLLTAMRGHPEWFLGTNAEVDENLRASWEDRGVMLYPREMDNVLRTAAVELAGSPDAARAGLPDAFARYARPCERMPLAHHFREKFPWYPEARFEPLQITKEKDRLLFKTTDTSLRITEHPTLKGERKGHWHNGLVLKLPFNADNLYQFEFEARGRNGVLDANVHSGSNNAARTETRILERLDNDATVRRRIALAAQVIDRQTLDPLPAPPPDAEGMLVFHITWKPLADDAPLEGWWRITRLDYSRPHVK